MARGRLLTVLALVVAPLTVALAVWLASSTGSGASLEPLTAGAGGPGPAPAEGGSLEPRSPAPVDLTGVDAFAADLRREPASALVFDVRSGETLYRLRPRAVLPIASLTKIMTAILVVRGAKPGDPVLIPRDLRYEGSAVGVLPRGKRVRLETLLNGLMIVSGNDAATVLATHVSRTQPRFVALMNETARLWGLRCTRFASPHGLEDGNRSCSADLAVLTRLAMRQPRIASVVGRAEASFKFPIRGGRLFLAGHNPLIRLGYRGAIGLKTGYTSVAGRCFVGVARRGGRTLGVVLLNSFDPGRQAARLLDLGFASG